MRRLLPALLLLGACSRQPAVTAGGRVTLHYTASVDGRVYDTSTDRAPVTLTLGTGALPPPVERALLGLRPGDRTSVTVVDAYGPRERRKVEALPLSAFGDMAPKLAPGLRVLGTRGSEAAEATVVKVEGGRAWLDFNHRLAGKTVRFDVEVLAVGR